MGPSSAFNRWDPRFLLGRKTVFIGAFLLLAIAVILMQERRRWHPVSDGQEVRIEKVIIGRISRGSTSHTPWRYRLLNPLTPAVERLADKISSPALFMRWEYCVGPPAITDPSLEIPVGGARIWLRTRGRPAFHYEYCRLVMPDGQVLPDLVAGLFGAVDEAEGFEVDAFYIPKAHRTLRFQLETSDRSHAASFEIPNPLYAQVIPKWRPLSLPQTVRVNQFEVTLDSVSVQDWPVGAGDGYWYPNVNYHLRNLNGEPEDWYDVSPTYSDEDGYASPLTGVFCQPVWAVTLNIKPTREHPQRHPVSPGNAVLPVSAVFYVKPPPPPNHRLNSRRSQ